MRKRITVDGKDITEHVAAMYDAIIGSADWGSEFLDTEQIVSILTVAEAAGFEYTEPRRHFSGLDSQGYVVRDHSVDYRTWQADQLAKWRAQVKAMVAANLADEVQP
jgi:hypothetical protein